MVHGTNVMFLPVVSFLRPKLQKPYTQEPLAITLTELKLHEYKAIRLPQLSQTKPFADILCVPSTWDTQLKSRF